MSLKYCWRDVEICYIYCVLVDLPLPNSFWASAGPCLGNNSEILFSINSCTFPIIQGKVGRQDSYALEAPDFPYRMEERLQYQLVLQSFSFLVHVIFMAILFRGRNSRTIVQYAIGKTGHSSFISNTRNLFRGQNSLHRLNIPITTMSSFVTQNSTDDTGF